MAVPISARGESLPYYVGVPHYLQFDQFRLYFPNKALPQDMVSRICRPTSFPRPSPVPPNNYYNSR